ncbi:hypothetical protein [Oleiharenicola lentus]|uniref:hypothetical protein n=1 Tax=Oleiharenicola lentus TaxID=2508720 RepID=UPI003F678DEF
MALNFSFGKKGDDEPAVAPLWHADFRDATRLPDTKVVRTTFFVNTAAIAVALGLLMWVGHGEITLHNLRDQTQAAQTQIDTNTKQNNEAIKSSAAFLAEQKKLDEVEAFRQASIGPTEFISLIAQTMPAEVVIEMLDMRYEEAAKSSTFQMRALVAGSSDQASGLASKYVGTLRAAPRFNDIFESISESNLNRNTSGGFLSMDVSFKTKPVGKEKK